MSQEAWTRVAADPPGKVANTNLVAAFATLGVPVRTELVIDDKTGNRDLAFFLATQFMLRGALVRTKKLMNQYWRGDLEKADPAHPLLDCLRGLHNAHCILDWMHRGAPYRLAMQAGGSRAVYVSGTDGRSFEACVTTRRVAVAGALGVLGIPLLRVEGTEGHHTFVFPDLGLPMRRGESFTGAVIAEDTAHGDGPYSAVQVLGDFLQGVGVRDDRKLTKLEKDQPAHPFLYAYFARENRQRLLAHLDRAVPLILLRSGGRSAFVHRDAKDSAWDQADDFLAQ